MAYICESCEEKNTFKEVVGTIIKIAALGAVAYVAFNYRQDIKTAVSAAVGKAKSLNGHKSKKKAA